MTGLADLSMAQVSGLAGVMLYLGAYFAYQAGWMHGRARLYAMLNIAAPVLVLFSLWESFNLAATMIQVSWIAISLVGILRLRGAAT